LSRQRDSVAPFGGHVAAGSKLGERQGQGRVEETLFAEDAMSASELILSLLSLLLAYGGTYVGDYLLDRYGV
jgi:hypothetical protein